MYLANMSSFCSMRSMNSPSSALDEDVPEVFERVRGGGLPQLLVGNGFLPKLVEKQLVGLGKFGAEAFVNGVDQPG